MSTENKFYDLSEDTLEMVENVVSKIALPFNIKIKYLGTTKMKKLVKLQKLNDAIAHIAHYDLIIYINEDYFIKMEEANAEILIYQEIDRLQFDIEKGTFKITGFQLQTNPGVLKKYGIDAVTTANQLTDLLTQQKADSDADFDAEEILKTVKPIRKDVEFLN